MESSTSEKLPLPAPLQEFREALEAEIEEGRKSGTTDRFALEDGRRAYQHSGYTFYRFTISSLALSNLARLPADVPIDLYVESDRYDALMVSVEEISLTVALKRDLGSFIAHAQLQWDLSKLLERLIYRLEELAGEENRLGSLMLRTREIAGTDESFDPFEDPHPPNEGQYKAVASCLGRELTFVWGPPGTGKTGVIGQLGAQLLRLKRTGLIVSHTNVAVDQAADRIARAAKNHLRERLEQGAVIRVGQHRDEKLSRLVRMDYHVDKRTKQLNQHLQRLQSERQELSQVLIRLEHECRIALWLDAFEGGVEELRDLWHRASESEPLLQQTAAKLQILEPREQSLLDSAAGAKAKIARMETYRQTRSKLDQAETRLPEFASAAQEAVARETAAQGAILAAQETERIAAELEPLRRRLAEHPPRDVQAAHVGRLEQSSSNSESAVRQLRSQLTSERAILEEIEKANFLQKITRRLPRRNDQTALIERLEQEVAVATANLRAEREALSNERAILTEVVQIESRLAAHPSVPALPLAKSLLAKAEKDRTEAHLMANLTRDRLEAEKERVSRLRREVQLRHNEATPGGELELKKAQDELQTLAGLRAEHKDLASQLDSLNKRLREKADATIREIRALELEGDMPPPASDLGSRLRSARERAVSLLAGRDHEQLLLERKQTEERATTLSEEIETLKERLKHIEDEVIANAQIVVTTLTRSYLRGAITSRKFHTVVLDEASMAPIPALWVAAALGECNAAVVGDFRQLPPIVRSSTDVAQMWLGRDIYAVAGVDDPMCKEDHFAPLLVQYRMRPEISSIVSRLFYSNRLSDDPGATSREPDAWYDTDWKHDSPLLLVDTADLNAWVTSIPRGRTHSSRLNFLSAGLCVDIAHQVLKEGREPWKGGEPARILMVNPYRPHAQLQEAILRKDGLYGEVVPGTAHSFQGSEADVVILDLVNDEPHWRVGMFMPANDDSFRRLFNVAISRARRRLIVVGNFEYISKRSKKAFVGMELLPLLGRSALLAAASEILTRPRPQADYLDHLPGDEEAALDRQIVNQVGFFSRLPRDLAQANQRVIIYSPFLGTNRLEILHPDLAAATSRGVEIFLITRDLEDRGARERSRYESMEGALRRWGVTIIHKSKMHEKLVVIDDEVLWVGSLNALSQGDSHEIMERRRNAQIVDEYLDRLKTRELIDEFVNAEDSCPICTAEMIVREGSNDPFYWSCSQKGCYSRSIGEKPLRNQEIRCNSCGSKVEYGEWGDKPHWRCLSNRKHRQKVARSHIKLPAIRAQIPKREVRKLEKLWGL